MNKFFKIFIILCTVAFAVVLGFRAVAQNDNGYSYVYIEGDKETPFYVKMEGKMLPRLSQHYYILTNLDAGVTNIEILFQQNKYAPIKFAVKVPRNGARGLILRKVDESFTLYDLQTGHYIFPGNKPNEDDIVGLERMLAQKYYKQQNNAALAAKNQATKIEPVVDKPVVVAKEEKKEDALPPFNPKVEKEKKMPKVAKEVRAKEKVVKTQPKDKNKIVKESKPKPEKEAVPQKTEPSTPKYLDNVVINEENTKDNTVEDDTWVTNLPPNTDCSVSMSDSEFDVFLRKLESREDEGRIKFIQKNKKLCFSTEQVSYIGRAISSTSGKIQVLKQLYAQTTDQQNYYMLEHLFRTDYLKQKFRSTINTSK